MDMFQFRIVEVMRSSGDVGDRKAHEKFDVAIVYLAVGAEIAGRAEKYVVVFGRLRLVEMGAVNVH